MSSKASAVAAARRAGRNVASVRGQAKEVQNLLLAGIEVPEPVFFCTIEPPSMAKQPGATQILKYESYACNLCMALKKWDYVLFISRRKNILQMNSILI